MARRMPISRLRLSARASMTLATLAQATSSSIPTAAPSARAMVSKSRVSSARMSRTNGLTMRSLSFVSQMG